MIKKELNMPKKTNQKKELKCKIVKCKLCKEEIFQEIAIYKELNYHPECKEKKEKQDEEQSEFNELCDYVFSQILGYKKGVEKFPKSMILRLKGLREGKFNAHRSITKTADYSYKVILYTFKAKKVDILNICDKIDFKDESHRFNTIMKIVEDNINDVSRRFRNAKKTNDQMENLKIEDLQIENPQQFESLTAHVLKKEDPKQNKITEKFKDLW